MKASKGRRAGFTLIELLVVVIIIGILAGVGVNNINAATDKARNSAVLSGTRSVFLGIEGWKSDYPGRLPEELLGTDPTKVVAAADETTAGTFASKYTPGAMLPITPWAGKPQSKMDSKFNAKTLGNIASIGLAIKEGEPLPTTNGFFVDGGDTGKGSPPDKDEGPAKRDHFGYIYYYGDVDSGRYAVFGVGKIKKAARVIGLKTNYQ